MALWPELTTTTAAAAGGGVSRIVWNRMPGTGNVFRSAVSTHSQHWLLLARWCWPKEMAAIIQKRKCFAKIETESQPTPPFSCRVLSFRRISDLLHRFLIKNRGWRGNSSHTQQNYIIYELVAGKFEVLFVRYTYFPRVQKSNIVLVFHQPKFV